MAFAVVKPNNLLLRGPYNKESIIRQHPEISDGSVMALLAPWQGKMNWGDRGGGRDTGRVTA